MIRIPESVGSLPVSTHEAQAIALTTVGGMALGASFISLFKMKGWKSGALLGTYLGLIVGTIDLLSTKAFDELECYSAEQDKSFCKGIVDASVAWLAVRIVSKKFAGNLERFLVAFFLLYCAKKGTGTRFS